MTAVVKTKFSLVGFLKSRLKNRPDGEHEMVVNRVVISALILAYLGGVALFGVAVPREAVILTSLFFGISFAFLAHMLYQPGVCVPRRVIALISDLGFLSWGIHAGDEALSLLYPIYLWVIFGNGFRFGLKYLFGAMLVAVAGFSAVVATTEYWVHHPKLAYGLIGGLVILPLYAATLIKKLQAAKNEAEQANKAKSLFLASISHEFRTPLNAVIGMSDMLRDTKLNAEQLDMTQTIRGSARALLAQINDILNYSRIEAGQMPDQSVDFDLHGVMGQVRSMLGAQAKEKGVRLSLHVAPQVPFMLHGNSRALHDVLTNLTANAVKFTDRGNITIAAGMVEQKDGSARIRFEVTDTGIGIAEASREKIFQSFTQADETIVDRFGGTGLGLAIVKQLVERQSGTIGVDSKLGEGSTFWFELGYRVCSNDGESTIPDLSDTRVILLTRNNASASEIERVFDGSGAALEVARTPGQACDHLGLPEASGIRRTIVIVDDEQLQADIATVGAALNKMHNGTNVSVILLTASAGAEMLPLPKRFDFTSLLARPVELRLLGAALRVAKAGDASGIDEDGNIERERPMRKLSILVADDNRTNQKVIGKILERAGHDVSIVDNGEQALDAMQAKVFDIALMDVNMPVLNGIEATKLHRFASLGKPRLPIVALTADATPETKQRCEEAGMDACVIKPIEPARLLNIIESIVVDKKISDEQAFTESETVKRITSHPKFKSSDASSIDLRALTDLEGLGGSKFVEELIVDFNRDTEELLEDLKKSAKSGDVTAFREQLHAMRSGAANIGARRIYKMCLSWRHIGERELEMRGADYLAKLGSEFDHVRDALKSYSDNRGVDISQQA
ncbi:MAG: response regulator [Rhizobiales bacterium]|nr:response regulator [Hyphomicrobiales bacterium]